MVILQQFQQIDAHFQLWDIFVVFMEKIKCCDDDYKNNGKKNVII